MMPRALVSQTRVPEIDRDSGSQQVDLYMRWLLDEGWSVTFLATETDGAEHHARRLRQLGIPTFVGFDAIRELTRGEPFDLALLAFWEPASRLLPLLRGAWPDARVVVDAVDVHFLREARRAFATDGPLDDAFGSRAAAELNVYRQADAVMTPSPRERTLLETFFDDERVFELPLAKPVKASRVPVHERSGMFFVGNFRHLPNGEAVEYLCREIVPLLDPGLLAQHPISIAGSRLDEKIRAHARSQPAVRMLGWVPAVESYLERARLCVVPLLHGAGIKGKIVESLLIGTPVVTTTIGAEGLGLRSGEHAVIADTAGEFADAIATLLTDDGRWLDLAQAGQRLAYERHSPERTGQAFLETVEAVRALPPRSPANRPTLRREGRRELAYRAVARFACETLESITTPGASVLVVSRGDPQLVAIDGRDGLHFPHGADGSWAGHHPADSDAAIRHLEDDRGRGARYLAIPASSFWWFDHYEALTRHLDACYRRIHSSPQLVVYELATVVERQEDRPERPEVLVVGTYGNVRTEPPRSTIAELERSRAYSVRQTWNDRKSGAVEPGGRAGDDADWTLFVSDDAVLPEHFLDDFLRVAEILADSGVVRLQPAHTSASTLAPPVTERVRGILAREVEGVTPLPVLAVSKGAATEGPTALVDACPIKLAGRISRGDPLAYSDVRDVFTARSGGKRAVARTQAAAPQISVLIATHDRPELLRNCLEGFVEQTIPASEYEVVVVDDGSSGNEAAALRRKLSLRLPLTHTRIEHAGRSAAKNLALMLARGELVLFFDDDDVPAPDLLEQHLRAHVRNPEETTAVLGHTEWAPALEVSPLMHYLTEVDKMLFSYGNLTPGQRCDWRCFWEGRVSSKRSLHLRHALHDQRLDYSIDMEMAWRLAPHGLEVIYEPRARSFMARTLDFDAFCLRCEQKGHAHAAVVRLHNEPELRLYTKIDEAEERWSQAKPKLPALTHRIRELETAVSTPADDDVEREPLLNELHRAYREAFWGYSAKGLVEGSAGQVTESSPSGRASIRPPAESQPSPNGHPTPPDSNGGPVPDLTVTMPVWSKTADLAEMAGETIERVWEVARLETEVLVVDNGSPIQVPLPARVHRFEENRGVASAWNTGIALARGPVVAVLNSDCRVEEGWDEALYEAVTTGRRIAFPYTDHCDGEGFRQADQAGTAGWCFMLTRAVFDETGPFDERFNPAYVEDTDYWHRAWELGVELTPVPDAHVTHARRTSADPRSEWLLICHRYMYGWKHGIEPMRPPPYYHREIVEYRPQGAARSAVTT
jgi:glycosyltransferase involved in cell wall biosynthesis